MATLRTLVPIAPGGLLLSSWVVAAGLLAIGVSLSLRRVQKPA